MRPRSIHFFARRFGWLAGGAVALCVSAQETIQFSKPADQDLSSKANSLAPVNPHRLAPNAFNAPTSLFGDKVPSANFDVMPDYYNNQNSASAAQQQKSWQDKKNWMWMTPEEILNLPTPEKALGVADSQEDSKMSPAERFLHRQDRLTEMQTSNSLHRLDGASPREKSALDNPFQLGDANRRFAETLGGSVPDPSKNGGAGLGGFNASSTVNFNQLNQKRDSIWASPFAQPEPAPKPTQEQLAGLERFKAMMNESAPEKAPEAARSVYQPVAAPDPNLRSSGLNSTIHSFTSLEDNISKSTGLRSLQDANSRQNQAKKNPPLVQPPPWMSDSPQSFNPPQRPF